MNSSASESSRYPGRGISFWVLFALCLVSSCTICSMLGAIVLSRSLATIVPAVATTDPPPAPTTPPVFGLTGQASCRHLAPPTNSPWLAVARSAAQKYRVDILAFEWQIWQESKFNPNAVSSANAIGIAQFLPETAASLGIDPTNPQQALDAAARLDSGQLRQFAQRSITLATHYGGSSAHYAYGLVLAAYNAGPGAVEAAWSRAFTNQGAKVWPASAWDWLAHMHSETRSYVPAILGCL
jgi:hypothetical protein